MEYDRAYLELLKRIKRKEWPSFQNPEALQNLNDIADKAILETTVESAVASALIYQQLSEAILYTLIECARFLIAVQVLPYNIKFKEVSSDKILSELDYIIFTNEDNRSKIKESYNNIRKSRNVIAHSITKIGTKKIIKEANNIKSNFDLLYKLVIEEIDCFYLSYKDIRKDCFLEEIEKI